MLLKVIYLIAIEETTTEDFTTLTISKDISESSRHTTLSGTTTGELVTTVSRLTETTDSTGQTQILDTTTGESNITVPSSTKASNTTTDGTQTDSNSTKDKRRNYTWIAYAIMSTLMVPIVGVFLFYRVRGILKKRRLKKERKPEQTELFHL